MKRIIGFALTLACRVSLFGCGDKAQPQAGSPTTAPTAASTVPTEPPHQHTFGEWMVKAVSTCTREGREERQCSECKERESRNLPLAEHVQGATPLCKNCYYVFTDDNDKVVELGIVCDNWYGSGVMANYVWDIKCWNGKVYRAAGDYDKNSGATIFLAYDPAETKWKATGSADDEAIHGFVEIGGTLYAAGIDATKGWEYGNYYVLKEDGLWKQVRNLPNGVHNFDMIENDGLIFAGLGTEVPGNTVAVSADGGKSFTFAPLYKDGKLYDTKGVSYSRTYEFITYKGDVYAMVRFVLNVGGEWAVFRYEDGKMNYMANGLKLFTANVSRKYFGGEFELNGTCYLTAGALTAVTDFSDPENWKKIPMPGGETVIDAFLRDGTVYVLASSINRKSGKVESYKTVIYTSTTGQEGSFTELLSFDYTGSPLCFDYDGSYFYIGTGTNVVKEKMGMTLRVKP